GVAAVAFILAAWLSTIPDTRRDIAEAGPPPPKLAAAMAQPEFGAVRDIVISRCSLCHSQEPVREGLAAPPKGVRLDTDEEIAAHARDIYLQAGIGRAMPPGNFTEITGEERAKLTAWAMASLGEP
ncbi:MAG: cysteine desulfurase, partial [Hyphomicrobiales bacterium]|nr:cysteine desulfurase [Hyphomicrobiales bacterium]